MLGGSHLLGLVSRALLRDRLSQPLGSQALSPRRSPCCCSKGCQLISPCKGSSLKTRKPRLTCLWVGKGVGQLQSPDAHLMPLSFLLFLARPLLARAASPVSMVSGRPSSQLGFQWLQILLLCGRILARVKKVARAKTKKSKRFRLSQLGRCVPDSNAELHGESRGEA